jgi:diguanylate cyclase (GGDEF)-like protein
MHQAAGTWLCPEPLDRARFVDMERRMRPVRNAVFGVVGLGVAGLAARWGWEVLVVFAAVCLLVPVVDVRMPKSPRPELWLMALALAGIAAIGVAIAMTGGPTSPALPWLVVPAVAATAVFTTRGVALALGTAVATALLATLLTDAGGTVAAPSYVGATIVLIVSVGLYVHGLMRAEVRHRGDSVLDPLTGLLNRTTLERRFEELRQQAALGDAPIALVLLDLDRFKRVNDTHGHERGDTVLRDVAYELRKSLRSFELAYRMGGEELLLILPGIDEEHAAALADHVRRRIAQARPGGLDITISCGVAAASGAALRYETLFAQADARLYAAKAAGRDRVFPVPSDAHRERVLRLVS